jgi:hypothetical protein
MMVGRAAGQAPIPATLHWEMDLIPKKLIAPPNGLFIFEFAQYSVVLVLALSMIPFEILQMVQKNLVVNPWQYHETATFRITTKELRQ